MNFHISKPYAVAGALVLIIGLFLWMGKGGDEALIHERLDELEALVSKSSDEGQLTMLTQAKKASHCFSEDLYIESVPNAATIQDRDQLTGYIVSARKVLKTIELSLSSRQLIVDEGGDRALVTLNGKINLTDRSGGNDRYTQRYQMSLVKEAGEWLISEVKMID